MNSYTQLKSSIQRIRKSKDQWKSILYWVAMSIIMLPILAFFIGIPIYTIRKNIIENWFYQWIWQLHIDSLMLMVLVLVVSYFTIHYLFSWFFTDIKIITLLKELEIFNTFWMKNSGKLQNIEEILTGIESIHKKFSKLHILDLYIDTTDSKYLFLQKTEIKYFIEILTDLRSDLSIRLIEQQQALKSAKSEVEKNIIWITELNQVSELQRARLDKQIEQFEELQRVLVKV